MLGRDYEIDRESKKRDRVSERDMRERLCDIGRTRDKEREGERVISERLLRDR